MTVPGRKLAVTFGFAASTIFIAGVVGGAGIEQASGAEASAVTGRGGAEAISVAGDQYSGSRGNAGAGDRGDTSRDVTNSNEHTQRASKKAEARGNKSESRQQRQQRQQRVSRESDDGESSARAVSRSSRSIQSQEIRNRVRELRKKEKAGKLRPAATSYNAGSRSKELRIAREQIVAHPVDEASLRKYKKLYEDAAKEYGFGEDWYVLAAVGKVESDHGQNMGPSSAGALGPMQFMPSTWGSYGVDANDDGQANIMDPEDSIPSAARYLKTGGAPKDWYEALYTYNHAGWYVEKVLKVAERYRRAAGDKDVGPYYPESLSR